MTDSIPQNLRNLDTSKVKNCKELTQKERNILLKFNLLAYDLFCEYRHNFWIKHVKTIKRPLYYSEDGSVCSYSKTNGMPSMLHMKDDPEWQQLSKMEEYLTDEFYSLKYGGEINQGNFCFGCECMEYRTNSSKNKKAMAYFVNNEKCKKWTSLRWCPLIKNSFGSISEKMLLTRVLKVL